MYNNKFDINEYFIKIFIILFLVKNWFLTRTYTGTIYFKWFKDSKKSRDKAAEEIYFYLIEDFFLKYNNYIVKKGFIVYKWFIYILNIFFNRCTYLKDIYNIYYIKFIDPFFKKMHYFFIDFAIIRHELDHIKERIENEIGKGIIYVYYIGLIFIFYMIDNFLLKEYTIKYKYGILEYAKFSVFKKTLLTLLHYFNVYVIYGIYFWYNIICFFSYFIIYISLNYFKKNEFIHINVAYAYIFLLLLITLVIWHIKYHYYTSLMKKQYSLYIFLNFFLFFIWVSIFLSNFFYNPIIIYIGTYSNLVYNFEYCYENFKWEFPYNINNINTFYPTYTDNISSFYSSSYDNSKYNLRFNLIRVVDNFSKSYPFISYSNIPENYKNYIISIIYDYFKNF